MYRIPLHKNKFTPAAVLSFPDNNKPPSYLKSQEQQESVGHTHGW